MDELIVRHLSGRATDIEARTLERWRAESPENEAAYRAAQSLWTLTSPSLPAAPPPPPGPIVAAAERRRRRNRTRAEWRSAIRSPWLGYGVGAAAVVALLFVRFGSDATSERSTLMPLESTASSGDAVTMSLSDGSVVRLAPSTTLEFPPGGADRRVTLAGRAFFAVAPGPTPFVVQTAMGSVSVVGTRFEVTVGDGELRLVVVEGTVRLGDPEAGLSVPAGRVAYLREGGEPRVEVADDVWELLDWSGGLLLFQETPLATLGRELERHFGRSVSVAPELAERRVTAWFSDEPVDEVVASVCLVAGAVCEVGSEAIRIGS